MPVHRTSSVLAKATAALTFCILVAAASGKHPIRTTSRQDVDSALTQRMAGGYWRSDHSFEPVLNLTNFLENTVLPVTPVIYAADGTEYQLPAVTLGPGGVWSIDINSALRAAPAEIKAHFSGYGSAAVKYSWPWPGAASAMVQNRDAKRSLNFNFELETPMAMQHPESMTVQEGLWWREDSGVNGFLALVNVAQRTINVQIQVLSEHGGFESERTIDLHPNETRNLVLLDAIKGTSGGVRVTYNGAAKDMVLAGGLENSHEGYSARIPFLTTSNETKPAIIAVSSVGLMLGTPDPMMKFPNGTQFGIYLALRNTAERPISIIPTLYYQQGNSVRSSALKTITLSAGQAKHWTSEDFSKEIGLPSLNGVTNLVFSYRGGPTDILMANGSIDQTKTYVFEVNMKAVGKSQAIGLKGWDVSNGNDTMVSLINLQDNDGDFILTFFFEGGQYKFPVHLESGGSKMFNVSDIIAMEQPDSDGNKIPPEILHGSAVLSGASGYPEWINVGVNVGVFNVSTATCGNTCPTCFGYSAFKVTPVSSTAAVGSTATFEALAFGQNNVWQNVSNFTNPRGSAIVVWSSSNSNVATSQGSGNFKGVSAGGFSAVANATLLDLNADCPEGQHVPCPNSPYLGSAGGTIYQPVPTSLAIVPGTDSTTSEAACTITSGGKQYPGCGVTRSFTYQVLDQFKTPIQTAGLQFWDSFGTVSPNPLNITGFNTTCTPANTGPCGFTTNSAGQFLEKALSVCANVCQTHGVCTTGGPSVVSQTWHVGSGTITQSIGEYCNKVTVNGN